MLNHVADYYDEDVNNRSAALLSWVEPVILIFVAIFVAAFLISLYLPIFSLGVTDAGMKEATINNDDDRPTARQLAERYRCEFVELKGMHLDLELFRSIQVDLMFRYNFVPLRMEGNALVVAMADPSDLVVIDEVSALLGRPLKIKVAPLSEIQDLLKKSESSQRMLEEATEGFKLQLIREDESGDETITIEKMTQEESSPIIRLVDTIIFTALERRASDIHIETRDTEVGVKYRIDGALTEAMAPIAKEHHSTIISRIKIMSELDISERRVPQDGRFKTRYKGRSIDFRVSIMPSIHGEDAVIRILDKETISEKFRTLSLDVVGFCRGGSQEIPAIYHRAVRNGSGDRADRKRQDDDAVRRDHGDQERGRQDHHDRGSRRISASRESRRFR